MILPFSAAVGHELIVRPTGPHRWAVELTDGSRFWQVTWHHFHDGAMAQAERLGEWLGLPAREVFESPDLPVPDVERKRIAKRLREAGLSREDLAAALLVAFGVDEPADMTAFHAEKAIAVLIPTLAAVRDGTAPPDLVRRATGMVWHCEKGMLPYMLELTDGADHAYLGAFVGRARLLAWSGEFASWIPLPLAEACDRPGAAHPTPWSPFHPYMEPRSA